ncbi:MAG TPA: hypothetical protein VFP80_13630 [Thermoanaerobaculia bacterium]|nr:hypothetical protein [Thermoanaerobaculia bacterium]
MYDRRGDRILTASLDATASLWNAANGALLKTLAGHHYPVAHAAISGDGSTAVTAELAARLTVWDARSATKKAELTGHSGYINDCALSHDGTRLGSAGSDRTARIWDASTGRLIHILDGHEGRVVAIRFSPDDALAATVSESAAVRLWSVATGRLLARVSAKESSFATVAELTPAGDALLTANSDGMVSLWSFPKETRTADEIAPILERLVPYRLQNGRAVLNRRGLGPQQLGAIHGQGFAERAGPRQ